MNKKRILIGIAVCLAVCLIFVFGRSYYQKKQFDKYDGHGFDYMHGYSSTDFTGYHVYDGEKLAKLDHKASLWIENEKDMPVMDGAEACYPVYCAVAKSIYKDIDAIEKKAHAEIEKYYTNPDKVDYKDWYDNNGKVVSFTNSEVGYTRLIDGDADLFFGARPSDEDKQTATEKGKTIISTPIGCEAFVFFVEEDNPVDSLTADQLRGIYHGDITNWKDVGGKNQEIIAFQRPEEAGSQVMMKYFMGDVKLKKPDTVEMEDSMAGVISTVKQYNNEAGALGYTFRYFLTGLQQEKGVKMLSVNGIAPTPENISNDKYPIIIPFVCAKIEGNKNPNTDKVIDFLRSADGQELITKTGYGPLLERFRKPIKEN